MGFWGEVKCYEVHSKIIQHLQVFFIYYGKNISYLKILLLKKQLILWTYESFMEYKMIA